MNLMAPTGCVLSSFYARPAGRHCLSLNDPHTDTADISYAQFCQLVQELCGLELAAYKREQTERRIRAYAARKGSTSLQVFWASLTTQPNALQQFLDHLTVNVTYFFRDMERFIELRDAVLPELLGNRQELAAWCAGCANGSEVYSLKMLLHECGAADRVHLLATDIDRTSLARGRRGYYSAQDLHHVPLAYRDAYFLPERKSFQIVPHLRTGIDFHLHDLLCDPYPSRLDLILCRNVFIYLTQSAQHRVFRQMHQALRPGGYLLVGNTERIHGLRLPGFVSPRPHFYRRMR